MDINTAFKMTLTLTEIIGIIDNINDKLEENRFRISTHIYDLFSFTCLKQFSKYAIKGNDVMCSTYENSVIREIKNLGNYIDCGNEVPHFIWGEVGELMSLLYELDMMF